MTADLAWCNKQKPGKLTPISKLRNLHNWPGKHLEKRLPEAKTLLLDSQVQQISFRLKNVEAEVIYSYSQDSLQ